MTEAFKKWCDETFLIQADYQDVHIYLSAFTREIREQALENFGVDNPDVRGEALTMLIEDFGLNESDGS